MGYLEYFLGFVLIILSATQFIPQAFKVIKTKSAKDLSTATFFQAMIVSLLWVNYGIWNKSFEIIISNSITSIACMLILTEKDFIEHSIGWRKESIVFSRVGFVFILAILLLIVNYTFSLSSVLLKRYLGLTAVVLNVTLLIPQAVKSFKTRETKDLSWGMLWQIFALSILWSIYGTWKGFPHIVITNVLVNIICGSILAQKYLLERKITGGGNYKRM